MNVVGAESSFGPGEQSDANTLAYIHDCMHRHNIEHIDIILVAYGHPSQELWVQRLCKQIPAKVGIGVGGTFDYFSGRSLLAPAFFVRLNLEWAFRLATQPWRYRRTVAAFLTFPFLVYKSTLK
jgi:exopolysaccharide biosynthesis WecB/TagA/CpsF family protein